MREDEISARLSAMKILTEVADKEDAILARKSEQALRIYIEILKGLGVQVEQPAEGSEPTGTDGRLAGESDPDGTTDVGTDDSND